MMLDSPSDMFGRLKTGCNSLLVLSRSCTYFQESW